MQLNEATCNNTNVVFFKVPFFGSTKNSTMKKGPWPNKNNLLAYHWNKYAKRLSGVKSFSIFHHTHIFFRTILWIFLLK